MEIDGAAEDCPADGGAGVDVGATDTGGDVGVAPSEAAGGDEVDEPPEHAIAASVIAKPKERRVAAIPREALGRPCRCLMDGLAS
jgi:hypothetical protein